MSPIPELTYEERIKMRRMLDALDQKEAGGMKTFDLNKPPVPAYAYREYPILLYNHESGQNRPAYDFEQRQKMLAGGWSESPIPAAPVIVDDLTEDERREAELVDKQLKKRREPK